jgi:2-polyprenyl-3-methyl-5-hydroxy-6-metoxy-1,4-benzoquinol methylase
MRTVRPSTDTMGQSPSLYTHLVKRVNVRSVIDVGCGRGISTKWFLDHGVDVLCVEGSADTIKQLFLPRDRIVQHDFALGPWWPHKTFDLAWSVEVLEHVGRHHMRNYMATFHKAAIIFVTFAGQGGWHHVEVHREDW